MWAGRTDGTGGRGVGHHRAHGPPHVELSLCRVSSGLTSPLGQEQHRNCSEQVCDTSHSSDTAPLCRKSFPIPAAAGDVWELSPEEEPVPEPSSAHRVAVFTALPLWSLSLSPCS